MSTRHQQTPGPLSQQRYMSSPEYAELHGVNGVFVSTRAAVLLHAPKRNLIWFIQGLSIAEGGLKRVAKELVEMFPDRLGTPAMHKEGIKPEKTYPGELVAHVEVDLGLRHPVLFDEQTKPEKGSKLIQRCRDAALLDRQYYGHNGYFSEQYVVQSLEEFLVALCINPGIHFAVPGGQVDDSDIGSDRAVEENLELLKHDFEVAQVVYFRDIIGALFEYQARRAAKIRENFQLTTIGKKIWETLDRALAIRGMVLLDGLEGRGKTEAVKAWSELHLGTARFVSLSGISSKTIAFREIAKALGIASSYTRSATQMQERIEDVLKRSKIMLVVDEAHFLFNQSRRMYSRPELVDWIDTALRNHGVPVALVTTPQFIVSMTRAADQVEWNYRQFRRRIRWVKLPERNSEEDIKAVARNVFKKADARIIKKIAGYALVSTRDLSAVGDVANEVRAMIGTDDLSKATLDHVHRAIYDVLFPSDKAFLEGMEAARSTGRKSRPKRTPVLPEETGPEFEPAPAQPERPECSPARGRGDLIAHGSRPRVANEASLIEA
jgi:hypothetical protein